MNSLQQLTNFVNTQIPIQSLVFDIILTAICAIILKVFYIRYGQSLSNRKRLASNFVAIGITTALVITIVKSSLALSLGLVGALSIVRFRTAIKEPEELAYLFLSIAIGLGFGASQKLVTLIAFFTILIILYIQKKLDERNLSRENLYLNISLSQHKNFSLEKFMVLLQKHCQKIDLKKVEYGDEEINLALNIETTTTQEINNIITSIKKRHPQAQITFTDTSGLLG